MKGCEQWIPVCDWKDLHLRRDQPGSARSVGSVGKVTHLHVFVLNTRNYEHFIVRVIK